MICLKSFLIKWHIVNGRKSLYKLLQLEPRNDMFQVISDIMAPWYESINTFSAMQRK